MDASCADPRREISLKRFKKEKNKKMAKKHFQSMSEMLIKTNNMRELDEMTLYLIEYPEKVMKLKHKKSILMAVLDRIQKGSYSRNHGKYRNEMVRFPGGG